MEILPVTMRPNAEDVRVAVVEFCLTTAFMATVFSLVRWAVGTIPASAPAGELRLRVAGLSVLVGVVIVGFAASPPGRFTGAHMNPAITLGLYASGSFPGRRVLPYLAAQTAGSIAATALARILWGSPMSDRPVRWSVVQPGPGWTGASVAVAEAVTLMVIVGGMCWMTARRPGWPAAWIVGGLFGLQGALLGTITGGSANPARQLGPALFSGELHLLAVYLLAPTAGGVLVGWAAHRLLVPRIRDFGPATLGTTSPRSVVLRDEAKGRLASDDRPDLPDYEPRGCPRGASLPA